MSFEVDVAGVGGFTLGAGFTFTTPIEIFWTGEIAPGQWFRLAPQLDVDNSINTSLQITYEGVLVDGNGTPNATINLLNDSALDNNGNGPTASFTINVISTPSHF